MRTRRARAHLRCGAGGLVLLLLLCTGPVRTARASERISLSCGEVCEIRLSTRRFLELRISEPDIRLRIGGRVHGDAAVFSGNDPRLNDTVRLRRGRVYLGGRILEKLSFKVEYEFAPGREGWRNLWLNYAPTKGVWIRGGNLVTPLGIEDMDSSNNLTFMERGLPLALAAEYQTGLAAGLYGKLGKNRRRHRYTLTAFVGTAPLDDNENDRHKSSHVSTGGRITYAPIASRRRVFHLGAAAHYRNLKSGSRYRVRTIPESSLAPAFLNTGRLRDVESVLTVGGELIGIFGPLSLQAEYIQSILDRTPNRQDPSFWGAYATISWIVTGESRRYVRSRGTFKSVKPKSRWGAVELAARVSRIDLTDETVRGGESLNVTVGANWYLRENARLMFNFVNVDGRARSTLLPIDFRVFQFRAAVFF
jgi:phosphate-selective porin OprO/OprP